MKLTTIIFLFLLSGAAIYAQDRGAGSFYQAKNWGRLYYADLNDATAYVYAMGGYLDKAGTGYSIRKTDTLTRQPDGSYNGGTTKIITENSKRWLVIEEKKARRLLLEPAKDAALVNTNLNNAYYLDSYFKMSEVLNKAYPLQHHSFRNGFYTWKNLPNKEMEYMLFKAFANGRLKSIRDSIGNVHDGYSALMNDIIQNLKTSSYDTLKARLTKLPAEYRSSSWYYGTVVNEAARQQPAYFFRLAADFPANRSLIFMAVEDDKAVVKGLKAAEGQDEMKKAFFKDRRFGKTMPYKTVGIYAVAAGLITWLIVSQK
jgi:hypothetical protein